MHCGIKREIICRAREEIKKANNYQYDEQLACPQVPQLQGNTTVQWEGLEDAGNGFVIVRKRS